MPRAEDADPINPPVEMWPAQGDRPAMTKTPADYYAEMFAKKEETKEPEKSTK